MADKKIPLLTEVYQPKASNSPSSSVELESKARKSDANLITPELIARIASHIKPRLEADITKAVTDSVREALEKDLVKVIQNEMLTAQASIEARTVDFVDKTKADLKTDLPRMYQASANMVLNSLNDNISALQSNAISTFDGQISSVLQTAVDSANTQIGSRVEVIKAEASARIVRDVNQQLDVFQAQSLDNHQTTLNQAMQQVFQSIVQQGKSKLQEQIHNMQTDALAKVRTEFTDAMPSIYTTAIGDQQYLITAQISERLNQGMQDFMQKTLADHQASLGLEARKTLESTTQQAKVELQQRLETQQAESLSHVRATFIEAMPAIYAESVASQQANITAHIGEKLNQEMQVFQVQSISQHQAQLTEAMAATFKTLNNAAKQDLQQQMGVLQTETLAQINTTFKEAIPSIYTAAADESKAKFVDEMTAQSMQVRENFLSTINADLPAVQEVMRDNIQQILATSLPSLELDLRNQLTSELQDLLLKVKFVLPK